MGLPEDRPAIRYEDPGIHPDDQAYYWTEEWQAGEREAEADIKAGRVRTFTNVEDGVRWLRDPEIARRSHLGAIVIVAAVLVLVVIAAALFVRGAS
jgi:hypothetical protein